MNQSKTIVVAMVLASAMLANSGCSTKAQTGQVLGAMIGGEVGRRMNDDDLRQTGSVLENNETGESTAWVNPDTGYQYNLEPTNTYQTASGPCREYQMNAIIDCRNETINGAACRQTDGSWQ